MPPDIYYLSKLVDKPVLDPEGRPIGRLDDLVVPQRGRFPPVMGVVIRMGGTGRGVGPLVPFLQWSQVATVTRAGLRLKSARLDLQSFRRGAGELLLKADLLDQQVIDLHGRKLVRVNDVQLVAAGPGGIDLRLAGIDVGVRGLLRRLELDRATTWLGARTQLKVPDRVVPWESIDPVDLTELPPEQTAIENSGAVNGAERHQSAHGLRLAHERLEAMHPADVAELVAQLSAPDRAAILESLTPETAAEALGELDQEMAAEVLEDLPTQAAVDILAELPPDEAADALAEVSEGRADELLGGLKVEEAETVRGLMAYPEDVAGGMMTTVRVALEAHHTAQQTIETLRRLAPPAEEIYYIYVVDQAECLVGVLSLRDLIVAPPEARIGEIVHHGREVVRVPVDMPRDELIQVIDKYNLLAVPVTDEANRLVGVITVDDALAAVLPDEGERRTRRVRL